MQRSRKNEPRNYIRTTSAKARSVRSNLNSSWNKNNATDILPTTQQNKEDIGSVINGFKLHQLVGMNNQQMGKFKRSSAKFTNKSIEELFEENLHLKNNNNRLLEQVMQLKGKFEAKARTHSQRGKQLDLQFEKQLYWGGSKTHLISGIKHQYQKLQKQHAQQSKQLTQLKKSLLQTKYPECQVHAQVLEIQNKKLVQKLKKITENSIKNATSSGSSKRASQVYVADLQDRLTKYENSMKMLRNELQNCKQELRQKQKKNLFLQKLLIQKDNNQYHAHRKIKKMQKAISQIKLASERHDEQKVQLQHKHEIQKQMMRKQNQKQQHKIREQVKKQIQELRNRIQFLLEDKRQLQTNVAKLKMTNSMIGGGGSSIRIAGGDKKSYIGVKDGSVMKNQSMVSQHNKLGTNANKFNEIPNQETFNGYESEIQSNLSKKQHKPRVMLTADRKHSIQSKKCRKVHHSEVTQIGELIKYRMIAAGLSAQAMKKMFDKCKDILDLGDDWQEEHINMKQVIEILTAAPFKLQQDMAHLLARYLIEDCNQQFVYCDEKNENKRQVIKSIMKTLVGQYQLMDEAIEKQITEFSNKYLSNLQSALKTYYPTGKVPKKKLLEVINSMGTQMSERSIEAIIAKVVDKSLNLSELEYGALQAL